MGVHLQREIEGLKRKILSLAAIVEENLRRAVRATLERNADLACRVVAVDAGVDGLEVDVEEECLKILALHQPVASDLRFIIAVLKIDNDLERIGDLAVNIAQRATSLAAEERLQPPMDLAEMSEHVQEMLRRSLDALVNHDAALAHAVVAMDDAVDRMNRRNFRLVEHAIRRDPEHLESWLQFLSISRYLERVADHAGNLAEDVVYMIEGVIVRHSNGGSREPVEIPRAEPPAESAMEGA